MKKTLLSLAVIVTAGLTQAASLNWMMSAVPTSTSGDDLSQYTVMLFLTDQSSSAAGFENFGKANTTLAKVTELADAGDFDALSGLAAATAKLSSAGGVGGATGYNGNNFGNGDSLTAFALVVDKNQKNYFSTGSQTATWTSSFGMKMLTYGDQTQAGVTYKPFGASQPDIPEPASGALALAGLALLFRRRRA